MLVLDYQQKGHVHFQQFLTILTCIKGNNFCSRSKWGEKVLGKSCNSKNPTVCV